MAKNSLNKHHIQIGITLSPECIDIGMVSHQSIVARLLNHHSIKISKENFLDPDHLEQKLSLLKEPQWKYYPTIIGLSQTYYSSEIIQLENSLTRKQFNHYLKQNSIHYFSHPAHSLIFDFTQISENSNSWYVVAASHAFILKLINSFRHFFPKILAIDVENSCLSRILNQTIESTISKSVANDFSHRLLFLLGTALWGVDR